MNGTSVNATTNIWIRATVTTGLELINLWSMISNVLVIIIIVKCPGKSVNSDVLLINQSVADFLQELVTSILILLEIFESSFIHVLIVGRLLLFTFHGVVSHTLSALSVNLYIAICKPQLYNTIMTWKRLAYFLTLSWLSNVAMSCLYYAVPDFYHERPDTVLAINFTLYNFWFFVIIMANITLPPFFSATFSYFRTGKFVKSRNGVLGTAAARHLRMSLNVHVITAIFLLTYIPLIVSMTLPKKVIGVRGTAVLFNYTYHALKMPIYVKIYTPFGKTLRTLCCCQTTNSRSVHPNVATQSTRDTIIRTRL